MNTYAKCAGAFVTVLLLLPAAASAQPPAACRTITDEGPCENRGDCSWVAPSIGGDGKIRQRGYCRARPKSRISPAQQAEPTVQEQNAPAREVAPSPAVSGNDRILCRSDKQAGDVRIAACHRLISSGSLTGAELEHTQKLLTALNRVEEAKKDVEALKKLRALAAGPRLQEHVRDNVCTPVLRDTFSQATGSSKKELEGRLAASCEKCFADVFDKDFSLDERDALAGVVSGRTGPYDAKTIEVVQKKYDRLFASCSEKLVKQIAEELRTQK
jgi:hypothetical protein